MPLASIFQLFILVFFSSPAWAGEWKVHFLDVGYGDAILIERPDHHVTLIDAGSPSAVNKIKKFLKSKNIAGLNAVVLTHPHKNHCGGIKGLTAFTHISEIFFNGDLNGDEVCVAILEKWRQRGRAIKTVKAGDVIYEGQGYLLKVLHPSTLEADINENSLVLWLEAGEKNFLFTADIGTLTQEALLKGFPFISQAHAVQIPHHGDALSPAWEFYFQEAVFVVSTGTNSYGLPLQKTLDDLAGKLYRTDKGNITLTSHGKEMWVVQDK